MEVERRRVIRNADNNPDWWLPETRNPTIVLPARLVGAAGSMEDGRMHTVPPTPHQVQVTTLAQMIELLRQMPRDANAPSSRQLIERLLAQTFAPARQIPAGASDVIDIEVVDVNDPEIRTWVTDVESTFHTRLLEE